MVSLSGRLGSRDGGGKASLRPGRASAKEVADFWCAAIEATPTGREGGQEIGKFDPRLPSPYAQIILIHIRGDGVRPRRGELDRHVDHNSL